MRWFEVDKEGLSKILQRRGVTFALWELVSNALDAPGVTRVDVRLDPIANSPYTTVIVEDDSPEGFLNLSHSFTLYAESNRKGDAEKRGRFNLGEKLVLALCRKATISSTTGTVRFDDQGEGRHQSDKKRVQGSEFRGEIRMTRDQMHESVLELQRLLPPAGIAVTVNCVSILARSPVAIVEDFLATEIAGDDGIIRRTIRKGKIEIHEVREGETAQVYELGIPVVETKDKYHVNVLQKTPLSMDRDNIPPAFLKHVRTLVLNATSKHLTEEDAQSDWARAALGDERASDEAINAVMTAQYGEKRVGQDPSDREAEKIAISKGYTLVPGGAFTKEQWANIKRAGALLPAGQVTPSPRPVGDGLPLTPESDWTEAMKTRVEWIRRLAVQLLGHSVHVQLTPLVTWAFSACYGNQSQSLTIGYGVLGKKWFTEKKTSERVLGLMLHEFAHDQVSDHLSNDYHEEVNRLGCLAVDLALDQPELMR